VADDVFCNQCGHRNPAGSNFCSSCGVPLAALREDPTTVTFVPEAAEGYDDMAVEAGEVPAGVGLLVVKRGPNVGSRFALDADIVRAGRHPESDIFLDDVTVSRRHAEVRRVGDGFEVADAGSLNGTYVNQSRVEHELLRNGDEVQVGKFKLVYVALSGAAGTG
jgi:pSer/pThr/pTyr-binding forkhead associated (FHA) protein